MVLGCGQKIMPGIALAMTLAIIAPVTFAEEPTAPLPEDARKLFASNCSFCHADFGMKIGKGPKLAGTKMTEQQVRDRIANGASGGAMPSYKKMLSEEKITALVMYIKGLPAD